MVICGNGKGGFLIRIANITSQHDTKCHKLHFTRIMRATIQLQQWKWFFSQATLGGFQGQTESSELGGESKWNFIRKCQKMFIICEMLHP